MQPQSTRSLPVFDALKVFMSSIKPETICMIIPPSAFLLDERVFVSLGILKIAACLEKAGHIIDVLDTSGISNYDDVVADYLLTHDVKIIALTATTPQLPATVKIVERIRNTNTKIRIILGGPHVTLVSAAVKMEKKVGRVSRAHRAMAKLEATFDVLVAGDGEMAIFEAIKKDSPKLVDGDDPKNGMFMTDAFYDASPYPARHLIDIHSYKYTIDGHQATSLIAQLGCPFGCAFCGGRNSKALRQIRTRTTDSIIREIDSLHTKYGYTGFMLYDDELNVSKNFVELCNSIADLQQKRNTKFRLRGFIKSELFNEEQAEAMYRAGFRWILCGFEAANARILENINKRATIEDNTKVVQIAKKFGLKTKALMSVGHAGETERSIHDVRDWLLEVKPDDFDCTIITTFPGTPYYDEALENPDIPGVFTYTCKKSGDRLHAYDLDFTQTAEYYKGDPDGGYHSYVFTDNLLSEQIVKLRDEVETVVRLKLNIPFNPGQAAVQYEHSMGQGNLPSFILKK